MILLLIKDLGFSCKSKHSLIQRKREFLDFYADLNDSLAVNGSAQIEVFPGDGLLIAGTERNLRNSEVP